MSIDEHRARRHSSVSGLFRAERGSDPALLECSAVRDGDDFIVNGQKTWTSYGEVSDWMFLIARTDPAAKKQQGITFMVFDLETPGVTIRPIRLISGASPFCESFFDNVRIPVKNVIHETAIRAGPSRKPCSATNAP